MPYQDKYSMLSQEVRDNIRNKLKKDGPLAVTEEFFPYVNKVTGLEKRSLLLRLQREYKKFELPMKRSVGRPKFERKAKELNQEEVSLVEKIATGELPLEAASRVIAAKA